ncbi:MAG: alpha amylase catalytic region [Ignavibacteria bacterium]|nr:alpha amylase catalytic region [Ignavibacteria bacterium]
MTSSLKIIYEKLTELKKTKPGTNYQIPSLWMKPLSTSNNPVIIPVEPFDFFRNSIDYIVNNSSQLIQKKTHPSIIYNMFVRHATAFDHNGDGKINIPYDESGLRETGTFLKAIALLPYIKWLGADVLYLLPITSIGIGNRKGSLGSPYAIRNPFKLDENLSEPALGLDCHTQFKAFVEAAHLLGMKVVLEFVFRTASIDSDLALEHPEYFYWIKSEIKDRKPGETDESTYGSPVLKEEELVKIKEKIEAKDLTNLPKPHKIFREMFCEPPLKVERVNNEIIADGKRIPSAFADWPPDDIQPPWSDVTYLRMYKHPDFNYIAYNTIRMYDKKLSAKKNKIESLWNSISDIIPHWQKNFHIDGVMIDMGHALPHELRAEIVRRARANNKDFIFWEENFNLDIKSIKEGYQAVVGYLILDNHVHWKVRNLLWRLHLEGMPVPFFASPENHNTPRAASRHGGELFSEFALALNILLPAPTFIHAGFELGETCPVNTGLGFEPEDTSKYPQELLPLFSEAALCWGNDTGLTLRIRKLLELKKQYFSCDSEFLPEDIIVLESKDEYLIAFIRKVEASQYLFLGSMDADRRIETYVELPNHFLKLENVVDNEKLEINEGKLDVRFEPFEYRIYAIKIDYDLR